MAASPCRQGGRPGCTFERKAGRSVLRVCLPRCMMPLRCGLSSTMRVHRGNWTFVTEWCWWCLAAGPFPVADLPYQVHPLDHPDTLSPASICFEIDGLATCSRVCPYNYWLVVASTPQIYTAISDAKSTPRMGCRQCAWSMDLGLITT